MKPTFKERLKRLYDIVKKFVIDIIHKLEDKRNLAIFFCVLAVMSAPIWLFYLLAVVFDIKALYAVASVYWAFWAGPMTPFFPLCVAITLAIRKLLDRFLWNKNGESGNGKR